MQPEWVAFSVQRTRRDMRSHLRQAMGSAEGRGAKRRHPAGEEAMQPEWVASLYSVPGG